MNRHGIFSQGSSSGRDSTFRYLSGRGCQRDPRPPRGELCRAVSRRLPHLLRERALDIGKTDKVFASQWITEEEIVVGTKCNKV